MKNLRLIADIAETVALALLPTIAFLAVVALGS